MPSLEIQTPDGVQRAPLDRDHMTIGRLSENDIALPYAHISRRHAQIQRINGEWWIRDLRSTNGLHASGARVREARLAPGEVVALSPQVSLRLLADAPAPRSTSRPAGAPPSAAEEIAPLGSLLPRSPYADDETPYFPQMRPRIPPTGPRPPQSPSPFVNARMPAGPGAHSLSLPTGSPLAPRQETPGAFSGALDPERQSARMIEERRATAGPPSPLLHVCQTCGQRTAPDAIYCQVCHHSIATECVRCRFSLLPIQNHCPRCQTPNPASARRARGTGAP